MTDLAGLATHGFVFRRRLLNSGMSWHANMINVQKLLADRSSNLIFDVSHLCRFALGKM